MQVAVIGGGAAGFFAALSAKTHHPDADVFLLEKTSKILSKVKVSGGGRCNVTNGASSVKKLLAGYPRGNKILKRVFREFDNRSTETWFEKRGVQLKTEADNRVFPVSDSSQTIIDCLVHEVKRLGVKIRTGFPVERVSPKGQKFILNDPGSTNYMVVEYVIVATGGSPKVEGLTWLKHLGHQIQHPVPSLFTFNIPDDPITKLMGTSLEVTISVQGTKLVNKGSLLITHWGMSGPAVLKLSSIGARELAFRSYQFSIQVNWVNIKNEEHVSEALQRHISLNRLKQLKNCTAFDLPERVWVFVLGKLEIAPVKRYEELSKKDLNRLIATLTRDVYHIQGKTTFKEEFVTCGGVSCTDIVHETMQSKVCSGMYFAGEVLDIDGITGGYNFQAAWSTGFVAGRLG